ncbi:MAG: phosphotransferase, partial [Actinobacteria bacterium]|nr:phosphotransferase [Actinomycetota bacterium]
PWAALRREADRVVHGVYDPDSGASFEIEPANDPDLPGLAYWHSQAQLVSYRPRRRATLTGYKGTQPVFIKVVRPSRVAALARLFETVQPMVVAADMRAPELMSVDPDLGVLMFSKLDGEPLYERWPRAAVDFGLIGRRLGALGSMNGPETLPVRAHSDLGWWIRQVRTRDPRPSTEFLAHLGATVQRLPVYTSQSQGVVHGDLHDGNLVVEQDAIGLLDLDMAGSGDPVRDLAMLTAHLELNALQRGKASPEAEVADLWEGYRSFNSVTRQQAGAATAIELTRLACLYRFRSRWSPISDDLLDRASAWNREAASRPSPGPARKVGLGPRLALQGALEPGRVADELRARWEHFDWVGSSLIAADVTRVHEREDAYSLELDVEVTDAGKPTRLRLLAEIVPDDVEDRLESSLQQLRRGSRGQLGPEAEGLAAVPALQMVVRRPGLDRRLPVLDLLHRPKRAAKALSHYFEGEGVDVELLGHRLDKRATLRARCGPTSLIVKGYKARSDLPEAIISWATALGQQRGSGPAVPAPLGLLESRRAVVWEDLGSTGNSEWGPVGKPEEIEAVGGALRWLHRVDDLDLPAYDVAAELDVLDRSQRLLEAGRPQLSASTLPTMVRVAAGLIALEGSSAATIHRDAHPGQFVFGADRVSIIDFDSLTIGEAAIDLGNYAAYLRIAGASDGEIMLHIGYQSRQNLIDRAGTWRDAALFRLGAQLALTTDRADLGRGILAELSQS